jgi:hypothetical protein
MRVRSCDKSVKTKLDCDAEAFACDPDAIEVAGCILQLHMLDVRGKSIGTLS